MNKVVYFTQSLMNERVENISRNKLIIPEMRVFKSINGYSEKETIDCLIKMKLQYLNLDKGFETYGTLANFLTKVKAFYFQVKHNIEYMCLIEDDLIIEDKFREFIESKLHLLSNCNMIRLDNWGEGYVTSLNGAKNIINNIYKTGIIRNIDNQLRLHCGKEIRVKNTPWKLLVKGNCGDCLKTNKITHTMRINLIRRSMIHS